MTAITDRIKLIKKKFEKLKTKDSKLEVFGAGDNPWYKITGHHYEFRPTLSEKDIKASEDKIGVRLPEEYREFLKQMGDGGTGPAWGIYELTSSYPHDEMLNEYPDFCSMEFPYYDSYAEGAYAQLKKDYYHRGPYDEAFGGYIKLANYGHEMEAILIVSGEQAGKMWLLDEGTSLTPFFQNREGREHGVTFLDWFENWLDESLEPEKYKSQF